MVRDSDKININLIVSTAFLVATISKKLKKSLKSLLNNTSYMNGWSECNVFIPKARISSFLRVEGLEK